MPTRLRLLLVALTTVMVGVAAPASSSPSADYVGPHLGKGNLPAGCVIDRDPVNPDNFCYHMKVGLNALDSPKVDVDIVVPVSPAAERDMRMAEQAVMMWDGGIHYLSGEMDMPWLKQGFDMNIRTHEVVVDSTGALTKPLNLVDPEIVVVLSNPAGGIGIGIDPVATAGSLGVVDGEGVPCANVPKPFDMARWNKRKGYEHHGQEQGGIYVQDCGGVGGNVCFAVNGAVDPVPGASDFFPVYELVAHEFGHCLTLGHVGDGADGPWGPTPTNDIMAYSTDPPGIAKCVSTLDVEGFALRMSRYLDVNGDGKVSGGDRLTPNDPVGDGTSSFQVQHPDDHHYASSTGAAGACPQPSYSAVPLSYGNWTPKPKATTKPRLRASQVRLQGGRLSVKGTVSNVSLTKPPTKRSASAKDATSDAPTPFSDLTGVKVSVTPTMVNATMSATKVFPLVKGGTVVAYSLLVSGRRLDSFIGTGSTDGVVKVMDNGTGYYLPDGTATYNYAQDTVTFHVRRDYLADQHIYAPYTVNAETGIHARSNDWIATTDAVPNGAGLRLAAPKMGPETRDAPLAGSITTSKVMISPQGAATFVPADSTLGVGLVSAVDNRDYFTMPIKRQAKVKVTLKGDGNSFLALHVNGGSGQKVVDNPDGSITVTVPWARRPLSITVDPQEVYAPSTYELKAEITSVRADRDKDGVPNVADDCLTKAGPARGAGCPDSDGDGTFNKFDRCPQAASVNASGCPTKADERVELWVDGRKVATTYVVTRHGQDGFSFDRTMAPGRHRVSVRWVRDGRTVLRSNRTVG